VSWPVLRWPLQIAAVGTPRCRSDQFLPQRLAALSAGKLAFSFPVEASFISIEC